MAGHADDERGPRLGLCRSHMDPAALQEGHRHDYGSDGHAETGQRPGGLAWHTLGADQALESEGVDGRRADPMQLAAVAALQKMVIIKARVRRDGQRSRPRSPARWTV
jgi:hypothetical protein